MSGSGINNSPNISSNKLLQNATKHFTYTNKPARSLTKLASPKSDSCHIKASSTAAATTKENFVCQYFTGRIFSLQYFPSISEAYNNNKSNNNKQ